MMHQYYSINTKLSWHTRVITVYVAVYIQYIVTQRQLLDDNAITL